MTGDPHGMVDARLKKLGRVRRVAATVPNFLFALAVVAETDLVAAVPRHAAMYAARFGVRLADPPAPLVPLSRSAIQVIATRAAMADPGVSWLLRVLTECMSQQQRPSKRR
jgi:DNA-binding transcriptional LysR family regulator